VSIAGVARKVGSLTRGNGCLFVVRLRAVRVSHLLLALSLLTGPLAFAAEGERAFSLGADGSGWTVDQDQPGDAADEVSAVGGQAVVDYHRGIDDTFWWFATANAGYFVTDDGNAWAAGATGGLRYAFDVARYVPFAQAGLGGLYTTGDGVDGKLHPVVELGLGIEFLESRTRSWSVIARFDTFPIEAYFLSLGLRYSWRWGFF
jgi:hypothetical protein